MFEINIHGVTEARMNVHKHGNFMAVDLALTSNQSTTSPEVCLYMKPGAFADKLASAAAAFNAVMMEAPKPEAVTA